MFAVWVACVALCAARGAAQDMRAALAAGGVFALQSTQLLNAPERRDKDVGYRIEARLEVAPALEPDPGPDSEPEDVLLCFTLHETQAWARGAADWTRRASVWDGADAAAGAWCAALRRGRLARLLLHPRDPPHVRDYKRALASLFQFQGPRGEHNETDAQGSCLVAYEALGGGAARKVRLRCEGDAAAGVGAGAGARRAVRLALAPGGGALAQLHAEEVLTLHAALKARSWHALAREADAPAARAAPPGLLPHALPLEALSAAAAEDEEDEDAPAGLELALREGRAALADEEPGAGGSVAAARALLRLLPALRRADRAALHAALAGAERAALPGLCRALGLAGTAAAARAAAAFTRLAHEDALEPLARAFLAGLALAPAAESAAVRLALQLAADARREPLAHAALRAAAAAARAPADRAAARDAAARALARCRDPDPGCRAPRLLALGLLRAGADTLLDSAERDAPLAAAAALGALRGASELAGAHLARLGRLAANASRPLELRAAALELVVAARAASPLAAAPLQLAELARALHAERGGAAHELRRVLWQRLHALRAAPPVRALLPLLPRDLLTWDARAHAGTSHVVVRETGWGGGAGGWRARLDSVQVAARGLLRRGTVALHVEPPASAPAPRAPELEVEVWTRGLEAMAGADPAEEPAAEPEAPAAGLAVSVAGVRLHDYTLFDGQAELVGHVWAGTGSTPTSVVRALRPVLEEGGALALLAGGVLRVRARAALALALDAHAAVSLWQRTARSALALRAALAAHAAARLHTPWAELRARRDFSAEPRLRIAAALDFYDGVALCVRASVPPHRTTDALRLRAAHAPLRVARAAAAERRLPGRTLALGRDNDAACRTLHAGDDDDDDDDDVDEGEAGDAGGEREL